MIGKYECVGCSRLRSEVSSRDERIAELVKCLRLAASNCGAYHHAHKDRHPLGSECPIEKRITAALRSEGSE